MPRKAQPKTEQVTRSTEKKTRAQRSTIPRKAPRKSPVSKKGKKIKSHKTATKEAKTLATDAETQESKALTLSKDLGGPERSDFMPPDGKKRSLFNFIEPLTERCVNTMTTIMEDEKVLPGVRLEAATRLLDRGYGKPKEHQVKDQDVDGQKQQQALNELKILREELSKMDVSEDSE